MKRLLTIFLTAIYCAAFAAAQSPDFLLSLANTNLELDMKDEALSHAGEALQLTVQQNGTDSEEYADCLFSVALIESLCGRHDDYRRDMAVALKMKETYLTSENPKYVRELFDFAGNYGMIDKPGEADRVATIALDYVRNHDGDKSETYASALERCAHYASSNERYSESLDMIRNANEILLDNGGDKDRVIRNIIQEGWMLRQIGEYAQALQVLEKAVEAIENTEAAKSQNYRTLITTLASINTSLGNTRRAALYNKKLWQYLAENEGVDVPDKVWADIENDMSGAYRNIYTEDDYRWLIEENEKALQELRSGGMQNTPDYASILESVAGTYALKGDVEKAIDYTDRALDIYRANGLEDSHEYESALDMKAMFLTRLKRYDEAARLYESITDRRADILGTSHPDYTDAIQQLAFVSAMAGKKNTRELIEKAGSATGSTVRRLFASLTTGERNFYWEKHSRWFDEMLPVIAAEVPEKVPTTVLYDAALLSKGVLLNTEMEQTRLLQESGDANLREQFYTLHQLRNRLNELTDKNTALRDSLEDRASRIERELIEGSRAYGDYTKAMATTWSDVADTLKSHELAVEFMTTRTLDGKQELAALTLRHGDKSPVLTRLCPVNEIRGMSGDSLYSLSMTDKIWKPLAAKLKGVTEVYFSPAGDIYNIAVEYLPGIDRLAGHEVKLWRVSSTRRLTAGTDSKGTGAAVFGGITYDLSADEIRADMAMYPATERGVVEIDVHPDLGRGLTRATAPLPGTKIEADTIAAILGADVAELITGASATEARFKSLSGRRLATLHIGTHGLYAKSGTDTPDLNTALSREQEALSRSALLMAGADNSLNGNRPNDPTIDDGILSAAEIAPLDLRGLDLVTLSACETARGDIASDGVMGLQRGFKKAGANSILMSLWKVDDRATQLFMPEFYRSLQQGMPKSDALAHSRRALADYTTPGTTRHPYNNWKHLNAFILLDP